MILTIKIPTHLGVYKLSKKARFRTALNLVRQRRKIYDHVGINIEKIILKDEKKGRFMGNLQPALF